MDSSLRRPVKRTLATCIVLPLALLSLSAAAEGDGKWRGGENVYAKVCGHCHEPSAGIGPMIKGRQLPPEYIMAIVRHGSRAMPAFTSVYIDDTALLQVAEYVSKASAPAAATASATKP